MHKRGLNEGNVKQSVQSLLSQPLPSPRTGMSLEQGVGDAVS